MRFSHKRDKKVRIIEELGVKHGTARVDIAVVNGIMHGYEIKSDKDTLQRLPRQISTFNPIFDQLTLVVGKIIGEEILGYEIVEERVMKSLLSIGKEIPTWPQLGSAATLNGVIVAVAARRILTGQPLVDNRANASVPSWLEPDFDTKENTKQRIKTVEGLGEQFSQVIEQMLKSRPPK